MDDELVAMARSLPSNRASVQWKWLARFEQVVGGQDGRLGQCCGMTPEDVRLVVAGGDEFSVVCRSLPHRDP